MPLNGNYYYGKSKCEVNKVNSHRELLDYATLIKDSTFGEKSNHITGINELCATKLSFHSRKYF